MRAPDTKTAERWGFSDNRYVPLPGRMLRSRAYIDLSKTSQFVLLLLMQRRVLIRDKAHGKKKTLPSNRGIEFSYREAEQCWGIDRRTFADSIDQLIAHGFLRIEQQGGTLQGVRVPSVYQLIDDWQNYGTDAFITPPPRPKNVPSDALKEYNTNRFSREEKLTRQVRKSSPERSKQHA